MFQIGKSCNRFGVKHVLTNRFSDRGNTWQGPGFSEALEVLQRNVAVISSKKKSV